jgi:hypothetical protein
LLVKIDHQKFGMKEAKSPNWLNDWNGDQNILQNFQVPIYIGPGATEG